MKKIIAAMLLVLLLGPVLMELAATATTARPALLKRTVARYPTGAGPITALMPFP